MASVPQKPFRGDLAVCILFHEKPGQTMACIKSFLGAGVRIHVWDNGSSPGAREVLRQFCRKYPRVVIYGSQENLGVSRGRNELIRRSTEEWLFFVDNDITMMTRDWVVKLSAHIHDHPDAEVFTPRLFLVPEYRWASYGTVRIQGERVIGEPAGSDQVNIFPGGAAVVKRRLFDRLGLYDEAMFSGFEDHELALRAIVDQAPVRARLIHDIEMIHKHLPPKARQDKEAVLCRYDPKHMEGSYARIIQKYGLYLESDGKDWSAKQVEQMLGEPLSAWKQAVRRRTPDRWNMWFSKVSSGLRARMRPSVKKGN
jgi:GT2 family glycosyltransferase